MSDEAAQDAERIMADMESQIEEAVARALMRLRALDRGPSEPLGDRLAVEGRGA